MTRKTRAIVGAGALAVAGALVLSGCGGSSFDEPATPETASGGLTSSDDALTILIGSSGEAETVAVEEAVAAWSEESGVEAEVQVANDLVAAARAGLRGGNARRPVLPVDRRRSPATPATARSSRTATSSRTRTTSTPRSWRTSPSTTSSTAHRRTSRRSRSSSTPICGRRRASPRPTSPPRGRSSTRSARRSRPTAPSASRSERSTSASARSWRRPAADSSSTAQAVANSPENVEALEYVQAQPRGRHLRLRHRPRSGLGRRGVRQGSWPPW